MYTTYDKLIDSSLYRSYKKKFNIIRNDLDEDRESDSDDEIFLNVSPAPKISSVDIHGIKSESYFLYKIKFKGTDSLLLVEVSQYILEQFINSVELEAFVKKYKDLSFFFGEETLYIKDKE